MMGRPGFISRLFTTPVAPAQGRDFDIDPFRGIVCLSLVALHFWQNGAIADRIRDLVGDGGVFAIQHLRLGVESFMLLAGVMMAHMLRPVPGEVVSIPGYMLRRFYRLIVPYAIAVLLAAADLWLAHVMLGASRSPPGIIELLTQLTLMQELFGVEDAAVGYWSLVSLEQFYIVLLCCYGLTRLAFGRSANGLGTAENYLAWITLALASASATCLIALHVTGTGVGLELANWGFYIAIGLLLYWAVQKGFAQVQFRITLLLLLPVVLTGFYYSAYYRSRPVAALAAMVILSLLLKGRRFPKWRILEALRYCGQRSYSMYLMHAIVGIRVLSLAKGLPDSGVATVALLVVALLASLFAAEVFYRLVERPWQDTARTVTYRHRSGREAAAEEPKSYSSA